MNLRNFHSSRRMTRRSSTCRSALLMVLPKRRNNLYISILPGVLSVASVRQRLWMARRALLMAGAGASGAGLGAAGLGVAGSVFMGASAGAGSRFMGASAAGAGALAPLPPSQPRKLTGPPARLKTKTDDEQTQLQS